MRTFLLLAFSCFTIHAFSQVALDWNWATQSVGLNGASSFAQSYIDDAGNTYLIGDFQSTYFKMGNKIADHPDRKELTGGIICIGICNPYYTSDMFVAKIDPDGNTLWLQTIQGEGSETGVAITASPTGEVWVVGRTNGDKVYIDDVEQTVNKNFLAKLDINGNPEYIRDMEGSDNTFSRAFLYYDDSELNIIASFGTYSDPVINIYGQSITSNFSNTTIILVTLDESNGDYISHKQLGDRVTPTGTVRNSYAQIKRYNDKIYLLGGASDVGIKYDDKTLTFNSTENTKGYVAVFDLEGNVEELFECQNTLQAHFDINDSKIAVVSRELTHPLLDSLLLVNYYDMTGDVLKSVAIENGSKTYVSFSLSDVVLTADDRLTIASNFSDRITVEGEEYIVPPSEVTVEVGPIVIITKKDLKTSAEEELVNYYSDILLFSIDYDKGLDLVEQVHGEYLREEPLSLHKSGDDIVGVFKFQSPSMYFGSHEVVNDNELNYTYFHEEPTGVFRYDNVAVTNLTIKKEVSSIPDTEKEKLVVYPNPSHGEVYIYSLVDKNHVEIYTIEGEKMTSTLSEHGQINLSPGTYIVKSTTDEAVYTQKLIVY